MLYAFPASTVAGEAVPSPKFTEKVATPSPFGVIVTKPVLSWVMSKRADIFAGEEAVSRKEISSKSFSLHADMIAIKANMDKNLCIFFIEIHLEI